MQIDLPRVQNLLYFSSKILSTLRTSRRILKSLVKREIRQLWFPPIGDTEHIFQKDTNILGKAWYTAVDI